MRPWLARRADRPRWAAIFPFPPADFMRRRQQSVHAIGCNTGRNAKGSDHSGWLSSPWRCDWSSSMDLDETVVDGLGHFAASSLNKHPFDSITLKGTVGFSGPVTLAANRVLAVGTGGVVYGDAAINLDAPYVALGSAFQPPISPLVVVPPFTVAGQPFYFSPTIGPGTLSVSASLIDIGNLSLQNISAANFVATAGDIRGDGTLDVAGTISMTAGQIYPPTGVTFNIAVYNYAIDGITYPGSIKIASAGDRPLPLSAGGQLNLYGSIVDQSGVLRAPVGTINVGTGVLETPPLDPISNEPVAATQRLTLGAGSVTSVSAVDPTTVKGW